MILTSASLYTLKRTSTYRSSALRSKGIHEERTLRLRTEAENDPPIRNVPPARTPEQRAGYRLEYFSDIRDLYVDDIQEFYAAMNQECDTVTMSANEFRNITMANITTIKLTKLTKFLIRGTNPSVEVTIGPRDFSSLSVWGEYEHIDPLFQQLRSMLRQRRRLIQRLTRIPGSIFWTICVGIMVIALIILENEYSIPLPDGTSLILALILVWLLFKPILFGPFPVVYPVWKRDAHPRTRINWREQSVTFVQGLILLVIGFLLGEYF